MADQFPPEDDVPYEIIRQKIAGGYSEEEFAAITCPVCAATPVLHVHPSRSVAHVVCPVNTSHLAMVVAATERPLWWASHVSRGWLD